VKKSTRGAIVPSAEALRSVLWPRAMLKDAVSRAGRLPRTGVRIRLHSAVAFD
jgi:hypothetical protein